MLNLRLVQVERLIDLGRIPALRGHALRGDVLRGDVLHIGAAVTHANIEDGQLPDVTLGLLPSVAAHIAYRAVRNRGTLGGSLAHADPAADWVSVMRLLDAGIVIARPDGERTVPASAFFVGPFTTALGHDELIVGVDVPVFSSQARWAYRKLCRKPGEFADAIGAAWVDPARGVARALMGALSSVPVAVDGAEALAALRQDGPAMDRLLDRAGLDDPDERDVHAEILRRALRDLDTPRVATETSR
jgi:carbon-monoxide dehydrogenase medium subunit